jgi:hypothetical protein
MQLMYLIALAARLGDLQSQTAVRNKKHPLQMDETLGDRTAQQAAMQDASCKLQHLCHAV